MPPQAQIQQILLRQIERDDLSYRFSPLPPEADRDSPLAESIRRVGILQPPILKREPADHYLVISGHRRLALAAEMLGLTALPCLVLPPDYNEAQCLEVAFEAIWAVGGGSAPGSAMETAVFCQRMLAHLKAEEIATRFLPRLGLAPTPFLVNQAARLAELEEPFAVAIHQGRLHETAGRELLALTLPDRLALFELIDILQLSVGNQKKLITACRELSVREKISLRGILGSPEIREILDHQGMNIPQKSAALLDYLNQRRFPGLTAAQAEFQEFRRGLGLPENFSLQATPSFEDDHLQLTITLPDRRTLAERLPALLAAGQ